MVPKSQHKGSSVHSLTCPLLDQERMSLVADFSRLGPVHLVFVTAGWPVGIIFVLYKPVLLVSKGSLLEQNVVGDGRLRLRCRHLTILTKQHCQTGAATWQLD